MSPLTIDSKLFKRIVTLVLIAVLVLLTFLILEPIILPSLFGLILAFMFFPIYKILNSKIKHPNVSALIITVVLILILIVPLIFLVPLIVKQSFDIYSYLQSADLFSSLEKLFSSFLSSPEVSKDLIVSMKAFTSNIVSSFLNSFKDILLSSPKILLDVTLVLFIFFFGLRDGEKLIEYIQSISPLSKEAEKKIFQQFKDVTQSVIFGQFVVGIVQGIATGIGLFVFGVPNALILTVIATFAGMLPLLGPWLVWLPVDIYLLLIGRTSAGIGLLIYGLLVISLVDNIIRPYIVSRRTKINSAIVLVSMLGGAFMFGALGILLGPLIISYLLLLLDFFRNKKIPGLIEEVPKEPKKSWIDKTLFQNPPSK